MLHVHTTLHRECINSRLPDIMMCLNCSGLLCLASTLTRLFRGDDNLFVVVVVHFSSFKIWRSLTSVVYTSQHCLVASSCAVGDFDFTWHVGPPFFQEDVYLFTIAVIHFQQFQNLTCFDLSGLHKAAASSYTLIRQSAELSCHSCCPFPLQSNLGCFGILVKGPGGQANWLDKVSLPMFGLSLLPV